MHLTLLIWRGEAEQRPGIWQRKSAHDGEFWLPPSPGGGDFWISSDYGRYLGLEAVKYMVTRRLSVALQGGLVTKDGGHCSRKDLRCIFCTHVQGECDIVSIFILCILIQMNISIYLRYCFQKLARGGLRILKGWGCSSEILNQTPKGDRFGRGPSFFWPLKETKKNIHIKYISSYFFACNPERDLHG